MGERSVVQASHEEGTGRGTCLPLPAAEMQHVAGLSLPCPPYPCLGAAPTQERSAVEADFAAGRLRVVVATVAFGMGINLAAVRAVVHATMPRSLEEYVQQVGWPDGSAMLTCRSITPGAAQQAAGGLCLRLLLLVPPHPPPPPPTHYSHHASTPKPGAADWACGSRRQRGALRGTAG